MKQRRWRTRFNQFFVEMHADNLPIRCVRWPKCFIFLLRYEFSIPNSEFRIPHFEKKGVYGNFVFGDATSGSVHGVGHSLIYNEFL